MNMVMMNLYIPLIPTRDPVAARTLLPYRTSRMMIVRVRRTLSETEIERFKMLIPTISVPRIWEMSVAIPVPM